MGAELKSRFIEPLPNVSVCDVITLLDYLNARDSEAEVIQIVEHADREFARTITIVTAAEMLGIVETLRQIVVLTVNGKAFVAAAPMIGQQRGGSNYCVFDFSLTFAMSLFGDRRM